MTLAGIELSAGAGLAPMAGVTDAAFRLLCGECGAAWCVSEMLSAKGWILSQGKNPNARDILKRFDGEPPCGLQLFGREPEYIAAAIRDLEEEDYAFIDLNFGCPAPKITGNGEGSAMMREPDCIAKVVRAAVQASKKPVTAKIRSGWDENSINAVEIARICETEGAAAVAVHARTRMQQYGGTADWRVIEEVKRAVAIPVIGNGDVTDGASAREMLDRTGCDGVLVGRAAQGNPWVFSQIRAALCGEVPVAPAPEERYAVICRHYELESALYGDRKALLEMRKHIAWAIAGLPGASRFRVRVQTMRDKAEVLGALSDYFKSI